MTAPGPAAPPPPSVPPGVPPVPGPPTGPGVLAPPPGPGVAPPFAAPPTEGGRARLWLGLGVGALAVLLCCGGGGAAIVGLAVSNVQAVQEQGRTVTNNYYRALVEKDWSKAYDQLCTDARRRESRPEFEQRVATEPQITGYRVGNVDTQTLTVPVDVTLAGGKREAQTVTLAPDQQTGAVRVCGVS
ncbi:hypothetical protein GA0074695_1703 [Micromonospora viridifaciens]|uniref:Uncharacterized protein n=1 Tax=Micromonospora viridifaciens TaxID=1881 RepID=A0A1C4VQX0_MICVI|nr:hypothetical protein [Micromonospora viridifaciens]SCE86424.1 hypothetical protein GA0074695_1703 [Micromonospora viridifaciens]